MNPEKAVHTNQKQWNKPAAFHLGGRLEHPVGICASIPQMYRQGPMRWLDRAARHHGARGMRWCAWQASVASLTQTKNIRQSVLGRLG